MLPEAGDMEQAEAVYAAAKGLNDEEGGFKAGGFEDSKVCWVIFNLNVKAKNS